MLLDTELGLIVFYFYELAGVLKESWLHVLGHRIRQGMIYTVNLY